MRCNGAYGSVRRRICESITPAMRRRVLLSWFVLLLSLGFGNVPVLRAQQREPGGREDLENRARLALSQNLADDLFLGTINAALQYSVHRHWTMGIGARYNNWTWHHRQDNQFESRQQTYYFGATWWPWYTYSGWWVGAKLQYQEYNRGGLPGPETEEGDAFGLSLGGGYAVHVNHWLNVDFGMFGWGGMTKYVTYACPYCGQRTDAGTKAFLLPDEVRVALQFIF